MKKILIVFFVISFAAVIGVEMFIYFDPTSSERRTDDADTKTETVTGKPDIQSEIIPSAEGTFGYEIIVDGKPYIIQKNIPGMQGNTGFSTKAKAQKVADLVISKIMDGQIPPTVTRQELDELIH